MMQAVPGLPITLAGESIHLLPQRAMLWPARRMLLVADIHIGKAAAFRARGVPVPRGTTTQNLDTLNALLAAHTVAHLVFLGDFLHAKSAHAPGTLAALRRWRARHPGLALTLVRGNHDSHAGDPPPDLQITIVDEPLRVGPFAFCHHPHPHEGAYVLAGHVHPVYLLASRADALRLPCFLLGDAVGILPAFGAFTGGYAVKRAPGEHVYVTTGDAVFEVPP